MFLQPGLLGLGAVLLEDFDSGRAVVCGKSLALGRPGVAHDQDVVALAEGALENGLRLQKHLQHYQRIAEKLLHFVDSWCKILNCEKN